jgi:glucose/arabinose dehydrogenase
MRKIAVIILLFLFAFLILIGYQEIISGSNKTGTANTVLNQKENNAEKTKTIAQNLNVPWEIAFLPNGNMIFTERPGEIKLLDKNSVKTLKIPQVKASGEGGLLGLALHPDFSKNNYIFVYYTYSSNLSETLNRVVRYKLINSQLKDEKIIVDKIPGAIFHNGGRIKFGPDKFLYITTGDSLNPSLAQDKNSLAGKILRTTDDGKPAPGNPFNNLVYSYGHRNPQGLTWDSQGRLWSTEHGPNTMDEINLIVKGGNYGWPQITGNQKKIGLITPQLNSGNSTWAPASIAYINGFLYFGGLRGQSLYKLKINDGQRKLEPLLKGVYGRIRAVTAGKDGQLYISTSNKDGRGSPNSTDDRIIKLDPTQL